MWHASIAHVNCVHASTSMLVSHVTLWHYIWCDAACMHASYDHLASIVTLGQLLVYNRYHRLYLLTWNIQVELLAALLGTPTCMYVCMYVWHCAVSSAYYIQHQTWLLSSSSCVGRRLSELELTMLLVQVSQCALHMWVSRSSCRTCHEQRVCVHCMADVESLLPQLSRSFVLSTDQDNLEVHSVAVTKPKGDVRLRCTSRA